MEIRDPETFRVPRLGTKISEVVVYIYIYISFGKGEEEPRNERRK